MNILKRNPVATCVFVAALGYFVDAFDLILFNIVRKQSLESLGYSGEELVNIGARILSTQMYGMLIGGILWGILGDKKGRLSVLFGSILIYSVASILNGMITNVFQYEILRFIAGVGLAGELGAGITLVSEIMHKEKRGWGTTIVASVGVAGVVIACLFAKEFNWRTAYYLGGAMGLMLLALRVAVHESGMFKSISTKDVKRGSFLMLFNNKERIFRYLSCILIGIPVWYVVGILITFSPEIAKDQGAVDAINVMDSVMYCYIGLTLGDLISGALSQFLKSRKKVLGIFIFANAILCAIFIFNKNPSSLEVYALCFFLGFFSGYWAVFITTAAEQFGTNLRATVATTVPNFVRGAAAPITTSFVLLKDTYGKTGSAIIVAIVCFILTIFSLLFIKESYGKDLDFIEK